MNTEQLLTHFITVMQQGMRQSRDGSHLTGEIYEKNLKELLGKRQPTLGDLSGSLKNQKERKALKESHRAKLFEGYRKAGMSKKDAKTLADKGAKEYWQQMSKANKDLQDTLKNFNEKFAEIVEEFEKKLDDEAGKNISRTSSNGRSDKIEKVGDNISTFGDSLKRLGDRKSLGGFSKIASKAGLQMMGFGTALSRAAGPIGNIAATLQHMINIVNKGKQIQADDLNFSANIVRERGKMQSAQISTLSRVAQNNMSAASSAQSAASSAASSAQSAAGAFAQEAVGIYSEMAVQGKKLEYDAYATSHEIASELPFDIKGTVYKAAEAAIDIGAKATDYNVNAKYAGESIDIARQKMNNQISGAYGTANANIGGAYGAANVRNKAEFENLGRTLTTQERSIQNQSIDYAFSRRTKEMDKNWGAWGLSAISGWYTKNWREPNFKIDQGQRNLDFAKLETSMNNLNTINSNIAGLQAEGIQLAASAAATNIQLATQSRDIQLGIKKQQIDMKKQVENSATEAAAKIAKSWLKMTEKLNDTFLKHQKATEIMGRQMGMTAQKLEDYNQQMAAYQVGVAKWGKDMEWMQKTQSAYQESSGRNVEWSQRDFETTASLGLVGDEESISNYVNGMELFNHSVTDSNEKLYDMFKEVSRIGLSGTKYIKDVAKNLKLVEKFNFKNGVDGFLRMSKWAQSMRFNVDSLDGMLDKVQNGGLEGIIKQAAELQVLGGNFAMGSDPLAMAYESYMDPEAYSKRMNKMIAGQGVFNSENGEVSFGIASQQMMRQYANSTGQDYKDVLNQARAQVKLGQIEGNLNGDFTEDQKMLIANKAQYDEKDGKWKVKVGEQQVAVDELNQKMVEAITPSDNVEQDMLIELRALRSIQEQYTGLEGQNMASLEQTIWPELTASNQRIINSVGSDFSSNFNTYVTKALENLQLLEQSQESFISMFQAGNDEVDKKVGEILTAAKNIEGAINEVKDKAKDFYYGAMSTSVPTFGVASFGPVIGPLQDIKDALLKEYKEDIERNVTSKYDTIGAFNDKIKSNNALLAYPEKNDSITIRGKNYGKDSEEYMLWEARMKTVKKIQQEKEEAYQRSRNGGSPTTPKKSGGGTKTASSSNKSQGKTTQSNNTTKNVNNLIDTLNKGATDWYGNMNVQSGNAFSNLSSKGAASFLSMAKAGEVKLVDMSIAGGQSLTDMSKLSTTELQKMAQNGTLYLGDMSTSGSQKLTAMAATGELGLTQAANNTNIGFGVATKTAKEGATEIKTSTADFKEGAGHVKTSAKEMNTATDNLNNSAKESNSLWKRMVTYFWGDEETKEKGLLQKLTDKLPSWLGGKSDDGIIGVSGALNKINDGTVIQNGKITRINDKDQVLAAKNGGPVDRMLDMVYNLSKSSVEPLPLPYKSLITENPYLLNKLSHNGSNKIDISPIQININGSIQLNGSNGTIDITHQIANDPNFIRSLTQMISLEVEKKVNGGKATNILNRNLQY